MCLVKIHKFPRISWKPITCYKILTCYKDNEGDKYFTPFQHVPITQSLLKSQANFFSTQLLSNKVDSWGIHAYKTLDEANFSMFMHSDIIVKCIIPRFTFYYTGIFNEICSRKMIICLNNEKQ